MAARGYAASNPREQSERLKEGQRGREGEPLGVTVTPGQSRAHDYARGSDGPYYTMELPDGGDLVATKGSEMCGLSAAARP
jgi:hypothetical protein